MRRAFQVTFCGLAAVLLWALPAAAQLQLGDLSSNLNGVIGAGYSADYGNQIDSSHGLNVNGSATAAGYYYNPNFVSFNLSPYYGQSRANSDYQSISDASGVNLSSAIFSGSHFPGQISYAAAYNSEGQFAVPGLPNYTTYGNSDTFGISWSEFLPGLPTLTASFQRGSNEYSVYGATDNGNSDFHSLTLSSNYSIAGFNMGGSYNNGASNSLIPQIFEGEQTGTITTDNSGFGFNVSHKLPLNGTFSTSFYRSDIDTDYLGYTYQGNFDTEVAAASMQPTNKLRVSATASYTDNLAGVLFGSLLTSGSTGSSSSSILPTTTNSLDSSHAWDLNGSASYSLAPNLALQGQVDRREQAYLGEDFGATSYSAGVTYARGLFGGTMNTAFSVIDSMIDNSNQNGLGFSANANYGRRFGKWITNESFSYAQNVSTLLITYMTSYYSYSGNVRRRWGNMNFNAGASFAHSGLTNEPGTDSSSQSYTSSFGYGRWVNLTGNYAKSNGVGLITGNGILPVNLSPILPQNLVTLYGGTGYGVSLSSMPVRKFTISASYAKSSSNTSTEGIASANQFESRNLLLQYQFRKMYLTGGYAQLQQGFSVSGSVPSNVSSYYIGVSRWFNFF
ncbi:MAG: hypothetical protein WAL85_10265 [Candidatus Korobacteraceae bacterium]